tara:strand:- start:738 stop:863 length:126 start_codon:yes stop_codon:yes gene_type:complete
MNEISPIDIDHVIDEIADTTAGSRNAEDWEIVRGCRLPGLI